MFRIAATRQTLRANLEKGLAVNVAHGSLPRTPRRGLWRDHPALMVALTYGVIGLVWITLSDHFVAWLVRDPDLLTQIQTYKGWFWILLTTVLIFVLVLHSVNEFRAAQRERHASDERYRTMIETTNEGVWLAGPDGKCQYVNPTMARMLGYQPEELIGRDCHDVCATEEQCQIIERILSGPSRDEPKHFDCEFRRKDGGSVWAVVSASPIGDAATGAITGTLFMATDITARKLAEGALEKNVEVQRGLLNELDHRVRNNLSSLNSLIDLSRRASGSVDEFATIIGGRVQAMAKAHALASRAGAGGMSLGRVLSEMAPAAARMRMTIDGPVVSVAPGQVVSLAMLFHELASRSIRSGALAENRGHAAAQWDVDASGNSSATLHLRWEESPMPPGPSDHADALIRGLVEYDLHGTLETRLDGATLVHDVGVPLGQPGEHAQEYAVPPITPPIRS